MTFRTTVLGAIAAAACFVLLTPALQAQVGKPVTGIVDANTAPEAALLKMPHMTPAIVKGLMDKRNFNSIIELNAYLTGAGLTPAQAMEFYGTGVFIHVNLQTGTRDEILLIERGTRMAREFAEYRPWTSWAQFDKEIGKYVNNDQMVVDKLKQYVFIPVNLNTATDEQILSIPGAGSRMVREFKEYRPWTSKAQFDKEISKYVGQKETDRLWRFVVIK